MRLRRPLEPGRLLRTNLFHMPISKDRGDLEICIRKKLFFTGGPIPIQPSIIDKHGIGRILNILYFHSAEVSIKQPNTNFFIWRLLSLLKNGVGENAGFKNVLYQFITPSFSSLSTSSFELLPTHRRNSIRIT